jgi:hypothetical protein
MPGGPYTVSEGGAVVLDAGGLLDPNGQPPGGSDIEGDDVTFAWDLDNDGAFGETGANAARGNENGRNPTFSAAGLDGNSTETFTVTLRVTDAFGGTDMLTATIRITNVAPDLPAVPDRTRASMAQPLTFVFRADDPGLLDDITYYIDWDADDVIDTVFPDDPNDSLEPSAETQCSPLDSTGRPLACDHLFRQPMHYYVRVIAVDSDGDSSVGVHFDATGDARINALAPLLDTIPVSEIHKGIVSAAGGAGGASSGSSGSSSNSSSSSSNSSSSANNLPLGNGGEDVNGDRRVGIDDLLLVINALRDHGLGPAANPTMDTNQDGQCTLADALKIIQHLRRQAQPEGEAQDSTEPREAITTPILTLVPHPPSTDVPQRVFKQCPPLADGTA